MIKSNIAGVRTGSKIASVVLLSTVSAFAINCGTAAAQEATTSTTETVVVRGIANSLKSSQGIKKAADVIVDSITAEDIGALPDRSVTEALSRVPGVSINRFAAGVDPDHFSVEGSGVTVRGLNLTRSELNGRDSFSANNGQGLSFSDVPSELMAGVDVFKNPDASMIEGGIAGAINLRTRLPLDSRKRIIAVSGEYSYGDFAKKGSPTYSALYSDSWETSIGKLGFLVNVVDSKLTTRSDGIQISNYACRTNVVTNPGAVAITSPAADCNGAANGGAGIYFPRGAAFRSQLTDRHRKGLGAAVQWRSNDETMTAALQYLRSETDGAWTEYAVEVATDNVSGGGRDAWPVYGTGVGVDDQGVFTSGTITTNLGWRSDVGGGQQHRSPIYGLQSNNIKRDQSQTYMTEDYSFNFKWTPNERWGIKFDAQHINSTVDVADNTIWGSSFQDAKITTNGDELPTFEFINPTKLNPNDSTGNGAAGNACNPANPDWTHSAPNAGCGNYAMPGTTLASLSNNFWRSAMDHYEQSEGQEDAVRLDAQYLFEDNNWVKSIDFGVRWAEKDQTTRFSNYNWGVLSEIWGSTGPVWMNDKIKATGKDSSSVVSNYTFDNFMKGEVANPLGGLGRPFYNGNAITDYEGFKAFALSVGDTWRDRFGDVTLGKCLNGASQSQNWVPAAMRCDVVAGTPFRINEINPQKEKNEAVYAVVRYNHTAANGWNFGGNIGLRYTQTERDSGGYLAFPRSFYPSDTSCDIVDPNIIGNNTGRQAFCSLTPVDRQKVRDFSNGAISDISIKGFKYDYLLPSFNLKVQPNSKVVLRLALTQTIAPPSFGLSRNFYNVSVSTDDLAGGGLPFARASVGNPFLKPTRSDNFDLSAEWYFAPVGSLTLALYHKTLRDVVTNNTVRKDFSNNGVTYSTIITTPENSKDEGNIQGYELAYQQTYDFLPGIWNGLGMNANYSYIESDGVKQSTLSATDPDVAAGRTTLIDTAKLPLQGLSKHNANISVFYEKFGLSARLAYNYRSDFLVTVRDVIVPFQPIMQKGTGQLDGSIMYDVTPDVKVGIQAVNLLNDVTETKAIIGENANGDFVTAGRSWFMNDRRFNFIVRAKF